MVRYNKFICLLVQVNSNEQLTSTHWAQLRTSYILLPLLAIKLFEWIVQQSLQLLSVVIHVDWAKFKIIVLLLLSFFSELSEELSIIKINLNRIWPVIFINIATSLFQALSQWGRSKKAGRWNKNEVRERKRVGQESL